ncbi:hypothetical protein BDV93DRAFT_575509, partial [Ceratobasidium sp. AG-I]
MPGKYLDPTKKAQIVTMRAAGVSTYKIGSELGVHPTTVSRVYKNYGKTRSFYSTKPKTGRPRKLSPADSRFAGLSMARTQFRTAKALQKEFFPGVHPNTVRLALHRAGVHSYARRKVPFLLPRH